MQGACFKACASRWKKLRFAGAARSPVTLCYMRTLNEKEKTFQYAKNALRFGLNMGECQDDGGNIRA